MSRTAHLNMTLEYQNFRSVLCRKCTACQSSHPRSYYNNVIFTGVPTLTITGTGIPEKEKEEECISNPGCLLYKVEFENNHEHCSTHVGLSYSGSIDISYENVMTLSRDVSSVWATFDVVLSFVSVDIRRVVVIVVVVVDDDDDTEVEVTGRWRIEDGENAVDWFSAPRRASAADARLYLEPIIVLVFLCESNNWKMKE